jgi:DNA-binding CsgD family transcriptional regulator
MIGGKNTMAHANPLSKREWEVVKLLLQGKSNKLIAASLDISERTVEFHLKNIYTKYQVNSRIELVLKLANLTGKLEIEKLVDSTVDTMGKNAENKDKSNSQTNWGKSSFSERYKTMKPDIRTKLKNALTGFAPGVFLFMAITIGLDGIRYFANHRNWDTFLHASIQSQSFRELFALELLLLTSGYVFATLVVNAKYLSFTWWRSAIAGVGAVILLAFLSIFIQPASLLIIALASLCTGMLSVLFTLRKTPQTIGS